MKMSLSLDDPEYLTLASMVEKQFGTTCSVRISAQDTLYRESEKFVGRSEALLGYFRTGLQVNDAVGQFAKWHFGSMDRADRFLEVGGGFGCATRFFAEAFGPQRVWAADESLDALDFVRSEFKVQTVPLPPKPEGFQPSGQWDCIFAGSLFLHLPAALFTRWLWRLHNLLAPGGLLIIAVNGEITLPPGIAMPRSGYHYDPPSDAAPLGTATMIDGFVHNAILAVTGILDHRRVPQGISFRQDLYAITKGKLNAVPFAFQYGPNGCVDFCRWTEPEQMKVTGWAVEFTVGESVDRIEIYYNGVLRGTGATNHLRLDVADFLGRSHDAGALKSGWDCIVDLQGEKIRPESDWLLAVAVSTSGKRYAMRLDHPANINEFESVCGWTYSEADGGSQAITAVIHYVDFPANGRFSSANTFISGWIATKESIHLEGILLQGRFGEVPFIASERGDVAASTGMASLGFQADLPSEYLSVRDPRLRFVTSSGVVLAILDTVVDL